MQLKPNWQHKDIDLLYRAKDFSQLERFIKHSPWEEVVAKRFPHKRAYVRHGILIELFLVEATKDGYVTNFWGTKQFQWPETAFAFSFQRISVVSSEALDRYRQQWGELREAQALRGLVAPE